MKCRKHWEGRNKQPEELPEQLSFRIEVHFKWNSAIVPSAQLMYNNRLSNPFYFSKSCTTAHLKAAVLARAILFPQMHGKGNEIQYLKYMYFYWVLIPNPCRDFNHPVKQCYAASWNSTKTIDDIFYKAKIKEIDFLEKKQAWGSRATVDF